MQDVFYNKAINISEYNAAMQVQRNKYEGKSIWKQAFWLGLKMNIDRIS